MFLAKIILLIIIPLVYSINIDRISIHEANNILNRERSEKNSLTLVKYCEACIVQKLNEILSIDSLKSEIDVNELNQRIEEFKAIQFMLIVFFKHMHNEELIQNVGVEMFNAYKLLQTYPTTENALKSNLAERIFKHLTNITKSDIWEKHEILLMQPNEDNKNLNKICKHLMPAFIDFEAGNNFMSLINNINNIKEQKFNDGLNLYLLTSAISNALSYQNDVNDFVSKLLLEHYNDLLCLYNKFLIIIDEFIRNNNYKQFYSTATYIEEIFNMFINIYEFSNIIITNYKYCTGYKLFGNEIVLLHSKFRDHMKQFIDSSDDTIKVTVQKHKYLKFLFVDIYKNEILDSTPINNEACNQIYWIYIEYSTLNFKIPEDNVKTEYEKEITFSFSERIAILEYNLLLSEYTVNNIAAYIQKNLTNTQIGTNQLTNQLVKSTDNP